eukprot:TRINITY_DN410_c0_g1_i1.p1 TRINITY_DN410_c0_g1~~TRINITY_DN410_c0_g1_i1.p1  ORF type:complete len:566 (-),score=108.54 TRINITY_DN410_c0_g1_i1:47-1744(-)
MAFSSSGEAKGAIAQSFDRGQEPDTFTAPRHFRIAAMPEIEDEGARLQFLHTLQEGDAVKYESLTHNTKMTARVEKIFYENGQITRIDLDVKKRANMDKITMVTDEAVETGIHAPTFSVSSNRDDLGSGISQASEYRYTGNPWTETFKATEEDSPKYVSTAATGQASPAEQAKFAPGQRVRYFSSSYKQYMDATVQEIRSDGTYNLDVKKGAKEEHMTAIEDDFTPSTSKYLPARPKSPRLHQQQQPSFSPEQEQYQPRTQPPHRPADVDLQLPKPSQALFPPLFMGVGTERQRPIVPARPASSSNHSNFAASEAPPVSSADQSSFGAEELRMQGGSFDPSQPQMRSQITSQLGFDASAKLEKMAAFSGGLNEGVWFLSGNRAGHHEDLVLKLVRCKRIASNVPTEAENLERLRLEHPKLANDSLVAFPIKIFSVADDDGCKCNDLIVMRKVPGERMAELICRKYYSKQEAHLLQIFEELGRQLAVFHKRYGHMQHGDFQPSNIFYDEASDALSFIDVGGMGIPTVDDDVSHLRQAMNLLAHSYGPTLHENCIAAFDRGYQKAAD